MKRKPNYQKSSELRIDAEDKIKAIEDKIKSRNQCRKEEKNEERYASYDEALRDWMTPDLKEYCSGPSYRFLCIQIQNYLGNEFSTENLQALELARENFMDSIRTIDEVKNARKQYQDLEKCDETWNHTSKDLTS